MTSLTRLLGAAAVAAALVSCAHPSVATAGISQCALDDLPAEAGKTIGLIHSGGPFPYPRNDGIVFQNREQILPAQSRGYYHEYTVRTPRSSGRGTRRIITGGTPLADPPHIYYTGDHYRSFCEVHEP